MPNPRLDKAAPSGPYSPAALGARPGGAGAPPKNINKTFKPSVNPSLSVNVQKTTINGGAQAAGGSKGAPGGDFLSNEDIRAFCEDGRKKSRQRAVERSLDAEMLEGRLRNIPDTYGSMSGARARARRVTRHLKRIAQAEKLIAKGYAALYSAFEREYESELMKIGKGRQQQKPSPRFHWR
jgi:hypothetical protein